MKIIPISPGLPLDEHMLSCNQGQKNAVLESILPHERLIKRCAHSQCCSALQYARPQQSGHLISAGR